MRVLVWHVHGSYLTSLVQGSHEYLIPVLPDRGPDGRGRASSWDWPDRAREVTPQGLADEHIDVVVLQRPHEADLVEAWTRRRIGVDLPTVYLEHNTPTEHAVRSRHPALADARLEGTTVVHVTHFNAMAWDCEDHPTRVVEHGIPDPGLRYTGELESVAVCVNEPVRRWRVAGSDIVLDLARRLSVSVYGMKSEQLGRVAEERGVAGLNRDRCHDLAQDDLHTAMARHRVYLHPYRWTSLGLSLIEAMALGMPVLALSTTEAPAAVPAGAGVVTNEPAELLDAARHLLSDPADARARGLVGREHALRRYSLARFLLDWDRILKEVAS